MNRVLACLVALACLLAAPALPAQNGQAQLTMGEFRGARETVYPDWFKESFLEFGEDVAEAAGRGKRIGIFFHQDGCPYCNRLVEVNLAQKDIVDYLREHFEVIAINMWGDREVVTVAGKQYTEKTFAAALRVQFTPTILFLDEHGKVALRLNGYIPPQEFKVALRYAGERLESRLGYADYVREQMPAVASGKLNEQPFFSAPPHRLTRTGGQRPLAVFFEQKECPNCDTLHREVLGADDTRRIIEHFEAVQLDMWSDTPVLTPDGRQSTAREWARRLQVNYAPTIVLFNGAGEEIIRSEAFFKAFHTQSILDYVLSEGYRHEPSFQRYISERAEKLRMQGITVDLWK